MAGQDSRLPTDHSSAGAREQALSAEVDAAPVLPPTLNSHSSSFSTQSYADTSESRVRHAGAAASAAENIIGSAVEPPRVNLSANCQVEHTSQRSTPESARSKSEQQEESKKKESMCIAEPQEQCADSKKKKKETMKMYEVPLTIPPKDEAPKRKKQVKKGQTAGRWTHEEHQAFLQGLKEYGREWKKVANKIPTRTSAQIRSHAQKYFSKIAREAALMMHQETSPAPATNAQVSIQRTAERILANPTGAQQEVEDTLRQLRERYRQLQIRLLEAGQRARQPMDRIVEDGELDGGLMHHGGYAPGFDRRKRSLEEALQQQQDDGASSVSSDLSHSLASLSPKREFGNEELIALHVLGGTLPRSASGSELHAHSRTSSFSETEDPEAKRQRLEETNDHDDDAGDGDPDQDGDETMI